MPRRNRNTERLGRPGAANENRSRPVGCQAPAPRPEVTEAASHSTVPGGEPDSHHAHAPGPKRGRA